MFDSVLYIYLSASDSAANVNRIHEYLFARCSHVVTLRRHDAVDKSYCDYFDKYCDRHQIYDGDSDRSERGNYF